MVKNLIFGAIRNNVLPYFDFELVVSNTISLANKRPLLYVESLRDDSLEDVPDPISPELLLRGYIVPSINVIPGLSEYDGDDPDYSSIDHNITDSHKKLSKVRQNLIEAYNAEFLTTLMNQSTKDKGKYVPVKHDKLVIGDIVLLKEKHVKSSQYPLGRVLSVQENEMGETTGATILKGGTREKVNRHVNSLIHLMRPCVNPPSYNSEEDLASEEEKYVRPCRKASAKCKRRIAELAEANLM